MSSDIELLRDINVELVVRESDGDVDYFRTLLAPAFAMRRANGSFNNRDEFLAGVAKSPERRTEEPSVTLYDDTCAVVTCIVSTGAEQEIVRVHNFRLFTRSDAAAAWRLLAWSNAKLP